MSDEIPAGYSFGIRATTGFDGGWHSISGDVWKCGKCGALVLPKDQPVHEEYHAREELTRASIVSLNEIISEITAKVSEDAGFTEMVMGILRESSHGLGFKFRGD